jgi:hypothetical protein
MEGHDKSCPLGLLFSSSPFLLTVPSLSPDSLRPRTEYNIPMRSCAIRFLSRISAAGLTLCLLIAPLCAARCSLSNCLPAAAASSSSRACHHHISKSHNSAGLASAPANSCQITDSLFTALPAPCVRLLAQLDIFAVQTASITTTILTAVLPQSPILDSSPGLDPAEFSNSPLRL